jgi:hypothetical protein
MQGSADEPHRHPGFHQALDVVHPLVFVVTSVPAPEELSSGDAHLAASDGIEDLVGLVGIQLHDLGHKAFAATRPGPGAMGAGGVRLPLLFSRTRRLLTLGAPRVGPPVQRRVFPAFVMRDPVFVGDGPERNQLHGMPVAELLVAH